MEWLRFTGLDKHYGGRRIFSGASGVLRDKEKIALVGDNGAGKSSLLRLLARIDRPEQGEIGYARGARAGYLAQAEEAASGATLHGLLDAAFAHIRSDERRVRELEEAISASAERADAAVQDELFRKYAVARETFERHGGEGLERHMRAMLKALGFEAADLRRPIAEFSGGQRTRASIARVLLEEPDFLLLDEPTNHLDIQTVRWLEDLIIADPRSFLLVSHDRYFIDRVADTVWEIEGGGLHVYKPARNAYTAYVCEKQERVEQSQRDFAKASAEEKRRRAVIAELRTHGSHNYVQVHSREKLLARVEPAVQPKQSKHTFNVALTAARKSTRGIAIAMDGLAKSYGAKLFCDLSLDVARGERMAVVGPNGSGKSTLLKIVAGLVAPDAGSVRLGSGLKVAYFSQDAEAELRAGVSAVGGVMEAAPVTPQRARALLGRLGLGGDSADKPVESFSGGERRRIMLARLMAQDADCLLLDEPTNDLDIASREALESVLNEYEGAMLAVSHDRYLLRRLTQRVLSLADGAWSVLSGGYDDYERRERGETPSNAVATPERKAARKPSPPAREKQQARLERDLAELEADVAALDARRLELEYEFANPGLYGDKQRVAVLKSELDDVTQRFNVQMEAWESALEALETLAER
ncbi:MAG: ABC-F family ATP-binding cassette domain-containing protein [Candidatus Eremiobacteraeota bacterium]|nr:ABC-F family ATP-binding cassette domain-containing protein [Candidatus Eremiobacteraeota bacterium]MBC5828202.1 ABC-F family ATP-binding cassette domain-containing protein [Candidatus Eremiobacteraeota bacterium]